MCIFVPSSERGKVWWTLGFKHCGSARNADSLLMVWAFVFVPFGCLAWFRCSKLLPFALSVLHRH